MTADLAPHCLGGDDEAGDGRRQRKDGEGDGRDLHAVVGRLEDLGASFGEGGVDAIPVDGCEVGEEAVGVALAVAQRGAEQQPEHADRADHLVGEVDGGRTVGLPHGRREGDDAEVSVVATGEGVEGLRDADHDGIDRVPGRGDGVTAAEHRLHLVLGVGLDRQGIADTDLPGPSEAGADRHLVGRIHAVGGDRRGREGGPSSGC